MSALLDAGVDLAIAGYRGYLNVFAAGPVAARLSPGAPVRRTGYDIEVEVIGHELVADGVAQVRFARPDAGRLPAWTPGAHLDVLLPSGTQRQYSLCGDRGDRHEFRIAVRRIDPALGGGGGSVEVHDALRVGARLTVRGPRNAFWMVPEPSYLFVAAGIGITPLLPMVHAADAAGADWRLVYLGRDRASLPFLDELAAYDETRVVVRTDDVAGVPDPADVLALGRRGDGSLPAAVYLCGPPALIDASRALIRPLAPHSRLFSERFSAAPVLGGESFTATLARTGRTIEVAADESLLAALRREVPDVTYSCQQGFCGSCRLRVLDGDVEHRDTTLLEQDRATTMLSCVSRGTGHLVLDL